MLVSRATAVVVALAASGWTSASAQTFGTLRASCAGLTVSSLTSSTVVATLPAELAREAVPPAAFALRQRSRSTPLTATRLDPSKLFVLVAVRAVPATSREAFDAARSAAADLLRGLPGQARSAVVEPNGEIAGAGQDRAATLIALAALHSSSGSPASTGSESDLVRFTDDPAAAPVPASVTVHDIPYSALRSSGAAQPCSLGGPATGVLSDADAVVARLTARYTLTLPAEARGPAELELTVGAAVRTAPVALVSTEAAAAPGRARSPSRTVLPTIPVVGFLLGLVVMALAFARMWEGGGRGNAPPDAWRRAARPPARVTPSAVPMPPPRRAPALAAAVAPTAMSSRLSGKRWALLAAVLLLTGLAAWRVVDARPEYVGTESLLVSVPQAAARPASAPALNANELAARYLSYAPSLGVTAEIVTRSLLEQRPELVRAGLGADYDVQFGSPATSIQYTSPDLTQTIPALRLSTRAGTARQARAALDMLRSTATADLAARQRAAGAPASSFIEARVLTPADVAAHLPGSRARAVAALLLLGLLTLRVVLRWGRRQTTAMAG